MSSEHGDTLEEIVQRNLKAFRVEAGLTQVEAAGAAGVGLDALRKAETGVTALPSTRTLSRLAEIYGRPVDHFFKAAPPPAERPPPVQSRTYLLRHAEKVLEDRDLLDRVNKVIEEAIAEQGRRKRGPLRSPPATPISPTSTKKK